MSEKKEAINNTFWRWVHYGLGYFGLLYIKPYSTNGRICQMPYVDSVTSSQPVYLHSLTQ